MTVAKAKVIETQDLDESEESSISENEADISSENDDQNTDSGSDVEQKVANTAWADSIAKILKTNKPKGKKTLVLSKAKKIAAVKPAQTKSAGFQVATEEGDIKDEQVEVQPETTAEPPKKKRKQEISHARVKPDVLQKDRERTLAKIATRGVVQLFNAVRTQKKDIDKKLEEAGPLDVRKEKVLKNLDKKAFLKVLMGEKSQVVNKETERVEKKEKSGTWSVLRDDFMMGAKLKDWDKEMEEESEKEENVELE